jgi:hypothetical protein
MGEGRDASWIPRRAAVKVEDRDFWVLLFLRQGLSM